MTEAALRDAALLLFQGLRVEFPDLRIDIDTSPRDVTLNVLIPKQPGLAFPMELNLQNEDELGFGAGGVFWSSWFPASETDVVTRYRDALVGVILGRYRIVEYRIWGQALGGDLQVPADGKWMTAYSYRRGIFAFTWVASKSILQNQRPSNDALQLTKPAQAMELRS